MPNERAGQSTSLVVTGDPLSRRVSLIREAGQRCGCEVTVLGYDELTADGQWIERVDRDCVVRLDSPGPNVAAWRHLMQAGMEPLAQQRRVPLSEQAINDVVLGRGEILHPKQWYFGFRQLLQELDRAWTPRGVRWMNSPQSVITAFDKAACRHLWAEAAVPIADGLDDGVSTYSQIRAAVPDRHARLFLKLRYGYSAMGAVALEWRDNLIRAITTAEVVWSDGRPRLFLSKKPRVLQREFEIAWLIDTLGMEGLVIEDWLPKARWQGKPFDVRLITVGGKVRHVVGRANSSPFTNLNLDAVRMTREEVSVTLGPYWDSVLALTERAAAEIPGAWSLGMDVLIRPCRRRAVVLEANAFGDYLPGLLHEGQTTYELELNEFLKWG